MSFFEGCCEGLTQVYIVGVLGPRITINGGWVPQLKGAILADPYMKEDPTIDGLCSGNRGSSGLPKSALPTVLLYERFWIANRLSSTAPTNL